jgi:Ca-activated chloride channel family protein
MVTDRGVRVYVIGPGSIGGPAAMPEGMPIYLQLHEPTLREVTRMTGGEYHQAGTAEALRSVYENLESRVQVQTRETEVTGLLTLLSAAFALGARVLSQLWLRRIV